MPPIIEKLETIALHFDALTTKVLSAVEDDVAALDGVIDLALALRIFLSQANRVEAPELGNLVRELARSRELLDLCRVRRGLASRGSIGAIPSALGHERLRSGLSQFVPAHLRVAARNCPARFVVDGANFH